MGNYNQHHLLWPRTDWAIGYAKELRQHWYLVVEIPMHTLHAAIHRDIYGIPPIEGAKAKEVLKQLKLLEKQGVIKKTDSIVKRLTVLIALSDCLAPATTEALKEQLSIVLSFYQNKPSD